MVIISDFPFSAVTFSFETHHGCNRLSAKVFRVNFLFFLKRDNDRTPRKREWIPLLKRVAHSTG